MNLNLSLTTLPDDLPRETKFLSGLGRRRVQSNISRSRGFTLVELLVVIMIIATLSVIGFASYSHVQSAAHNAVCTGNLREIGIMSQLYASDNNGQLLPPMIASPNTWDSALAEYTQTKGAPEVWKCPADKVKRKGTKKWPGDSNVIAPPRSYFANAFVFNLWGAHTAYPEQPANTAAVFNRIRNVADPTWDPSNMWIISELHQEEGGGDLVMGTHDGGVMGGPPRATHGAHVNAVMLDGSVTSRIPGTDQWWGLGQRAR